MVTLCETNRYRALLLPTVKKKSSIEVWKRDIKGSLEKKVHLITCYVFKITKTICFRAGEHEYLRLTENVIKNKQIFIKIKDITERYDVTVDILKQINSSGKLLSFLCHKKNVHKTEGNSTMKSMPKIYLRGDNLICDLRYGQIEEDGSQEKFGFSWAKSVLDWKKLDKEYKAYRYIYKEIEKLLLEDSLNDFMDKICQEDKINGSLMLPVVLAVRVAYFETPTYTKFKKRIFTDACNVVKIISECFSPKKFYFIDQKDLIYSPKRGCLADVELIHELIEKALDDNVGISLDDLHKKILCQFESLVMESYDSETHFCRVLDENKATIEEIKRSVCGMLCHIRNEGISLSVDQVNQLRMIFIKREQLDSEFKIVLDHIYLQSILRAFKEVEKKWIFSIEITDEDCWCCAHKIVQSAIADSLERKVNYPMQAAAYLHYLFRIWKHKALDIYTQTS
ncbi:MAG: hypothetical protein P4L16_08440 [Chlamydiales bacterium]|nr:hypothetical protein [Chlamydiales bacterium]